MENKELLVPKLRFPGFTGSWEQCKFGDLAEYKKGPFGSAITKDMFIPNDENAVKVYEQQNAINKDWSLERYYLPKEYVLKKLKSFQVHGGDIIVSCAGTIGEIYEIPENAESGIINQALMRIRVNERVVNKNMFIIAFSNMINEFSRTRSNGSAIKNIPPFADLKSMEVLLPSIGEQAKISKIFESLDNLIALHHRRCESIKKYKKGILQKMFPQNGENYPEIRFPGFTDPWEQRKLNEYLEVSKAKNKDEVFGKEDVLSVSGDYGVLNQIEFQGRSLAGVSVAPYGVVETGDVVYTKSPLKSNPYGIIKTNKGKPGIVSTLYAVYKPLDNVYPEFVQIYFELDARMNNYMHPLVNKGAKNDMKVSAENALKGEVCFPSRDEQIKISEYFAKLDNLITLHQRKCDELKKMKKALLQKMFV